MDSTSSVQTEEQRYVIRGETTDLAASQVLAYGDDFVVVDPIGDRAGQEGLAELMHRLTLNLSEMKSSATSSPTFLGQEI